MFSFLPAQYYSLVYYWSMACICLFTSLNYIASDNCSKLLSKNSSIIPFFFIALLVFFIGFRPISWIFQDMAMYAHSYNMCDVNSFSGFFDFHSEWLFDFLMKFCKATIRDINIWFFIIAVIGFLCPFFACKKLLHENVWMAMLFVCFSYQFYPFVTNGLRNGMGTAIMMLAIAFFSERNTKGIVIGLFLSSLAMGCHRSTMIPIAAVWVSLFVVKDIKNAIWIWVGCVLLSIVSGNTFLNVFSSLGFDDRMATYSSDKTDYGFSHTGFRWDFLLYSAAPIWMAKYIRDRGINDKTFTFLANTYIIANSFWVLVCRIAFSNRVAYLSWFMYGLVLAYAVIRVPIWKNQDKKAGQILLAHSFFTFFMFLIGK